MTKPKLAPFAENIAESTTACLVTMVQGNLLAISLQHWVIASQTGVMAGVVATVAILLAHEKRRWLISTLLGVTTAFVDYLVHPGQFGPAVAEAVVTGIGAAVLSFVVGSLVTRFRRRHAATG